MIRDDNIRNINERGPKKVGKIVNKINTLPTSRSRVANWQSSFIHIAITLSILNIFE